jgi:two-component system CheB/CheR fusion protein
MAEEPKRKSSRKAPAARAKASAFRPQAVAADGADGKRPTRAGFPVVGVGASAGGLEALKAFLSTVPASTGMAFLIVQHLDPKQKSHMAELLAKQTAMPVAEAEEGRPVQPNCV